MTCLQSNAFLNRILYLCVTGLSSYNGASISLTTNWTKSQSNCKDPLSTVNSATDICELNEIFLPFIYFHHLYAEKPTR
jgi:hypothetical protein